MASLFHKNSLSKLSGTTASRPQEGPNPWSGPPIQCSCSAPESPLSLNGGKSGVEPLAWARCRSLTRWWPAFDSGPRRCAPGGSPDRRSEERQRFREQAQIDFTDYAMIGDAEAELVEGILTLRIDLRPKKHAEAQDG